MSEAATPFEELASRQLLLETTSDAVFCIDLGTRRIASANVGLETITGHAVDRLQGADASILRPSRHEPRDVVFGEGVYASEGLHEDVLLVRADGFSAHVTIRVTHMRVQSRPVAVCVARDATERRMLERELITKHLALAEAHRELQQRVKQLRSVSEALGDRRREISELSARMATTSRRAMLGEIVAEIAHSMNNPLGALTSSLRTLERFDEHLSDERTRDRHRAIVARCQTASQRMAHVVAELRVACRTGSVAGAHAVVDLRHEIDAALSLLSHEVPPDVSVKVHVDQGACTRAAADDVHHAILNLIHNALQAVGKQGDVRIECRMRKSSVDITVADSGPGVDAGLVERIFEPFFTTKPKGQGTGLGLSMVRRAARRYGGTVTVEPHGPLGGARFCMTLAAGADA